MQSQSFQLFQFHYYVVSAGNIKKNLNVHQEETLIISFV